MGKNMNLKRLNRATRKTWDRIAGKYHEAFKNEMQEKPFDREYLDRFASRLGKDAVICDAGCGPSGHIGRYLSDKGFNVCGIDISPKCIAIARDWNPHMTFECADFLDWKRSPGSLDAIISFYSIIYVPKKEVGRILSVFSSKLKPGGRLLIVVKKGDFEGWQTSVLGTKVHSWFAEYDEDELASCITDAGFMIDDLEVRDPYDGEIANPRMYCTCTKAGG
jgi:2-polyprenyl-3-methyl-5-hydroxy-6-metoxy-1,4-benzoquinol methylase